MSQHVQPHRRFNPLTGQWVLVSPHRTQRPWQGKQEQASGTGSESRTYNLGNGLGFSVKQVILAARQVTGHEIPARVVQRRPGDVARLIAGSDKIKGELGWEPRLPDIKQIIETVWQWHKNHPQGYRSLEAECSHA